MARIYLTGARGSGKSTVGRLLASQLQWPFIDLDAFLCSGEGRSIAEIVRLDGWQAFRNLEKKYLANASRAEDVIIATGGGIVLDAENRVFMRASGYVFWLHASPEVLHERLARNPSHEQRPALTEKGMLEEINDILRQRKGLYENACHWIINAESDAGQICALVRECAGV